MKKRDRVKNHELPDCMLVYYSPWLTSRDWVAAGEELCHQGWADLHLGGINAGDARRAKRR